MFVQTNNIKEIKKYFRKNLEELYSENEINLIIKESVIQRLGISSAEYLIADNQLLSESDLLFFRSIVKKIQSHEPFQYVIGNTEFFGLEFKTDRRALIPRPETEELVDWITHFFPKEISLNGMDLCTGSGCIAISLKSYFTNSGIKATDISEEALALAKENADVLNLPIETLRFDILNENSFAEFDNNSFDFWVSNPPYIPQKEKALMETKVLDFEPSIALFVSDEDPLLFYREIANKAIMYLKEKGMLFFELNENFADETTKLLEEIGFVNIELRKDLQGKDRMLKAQKP